MTARVLEKGKYGLKLMLLLAFVYFLPFAVQSETVMGSAKKLFSQPEKVQKITAPSFAQPTRISLFQR